MDWMAGGQFADNPIGVEFEPDVLQQCLQSGTPAAELVQRGSAPPPG
nr:hypothetical protein [Mycobacterium sp.]